MSNSNVSSITISIMDKDYRVSCPDGEEATLQASADFLNNKLKDIRDRGSVIGSERIAIMAALNLAHELLNNQEHESNLTNLDSRVVNLQKKIDIALNEIEVT